MVLRRQTTITTITRIHNKTSNNNNNMILISSSLSSLLLWQLCMMFLLCMSFNNPTTYGWIITTPNNNNNYHYYHLSSRSTTNNKDFATLLFSVEPKKVEETELSSTSATATTTTTTTTTKQEATTNTDLSTTNDEEDEEYEYIEYEALTENEFLNSEWLVGTNWDRNSNKIEETWVRLIVDNDGKNVAIWGDNSQGTWNIDVATQFLSISKENVFIGKDIWACTVDDDYYYLQGTVRGWKYWSAAAVLGQWQAKRLGVDKDEAGTPPWF